MIWRVIIAVVCVFFAFMLIPLVLDVLDLSVPGSMIQIIRLCIAALAVLYIIRGPWTAA